MKKYNYKIMACLMVLLAGFFMLFSAVPSATAQEARIVEVGTGSGNWGGTVTLPISVDNPSGIGGIAFTLNFDPNIFEFTSITQAVKTLSNGDEYKVGDVYVVNDDQKTMVGSTLFYQTNADNTNGKVLVAAASATAQTQTTKTALLNAQFKIKSSGSGDYTIGIVRSIIDNPAAGYNGPTFIPVLVGVPTDAAPDVYPQYATTLKNGKITVTSTVNYTISGNVTYQGAGAAIDGTPVTLQKLVGSSYVNDGSTTVTSGAYSFAKKLNGSYRVVVSSLNPNYFSASGDVAVSSANATKDIVLPSPVRVSGKLNINGQVLPGLKVKVVDSNQNVVGTFAVNADGSFSSGPLLPGTYTTYAVYGSLEEQFTASDTLYDWTETLNSITGTISGLGSGVVTVTAGSETGRIFRTIDVTVNGATDYEILNLVPAADYKVSATVMGQPVQYFNNKSDITQADSVDITGANGDADFDFTSTSKATISGTLTEGGSPLDDVAVFAFNVNTYALVSADTDVNGDYLMTVAPGTYEIYVVDDYGIVYYYSTSGATTNWSNLSVVTVAATQNADIDIVIPTPCDETLTGSVTFEGGDPVAFALVVATSQEDMAMTITGLDGAYTLTGLCDGDDYTVEMDPVTGNYGVQTVNIIAGDVTTLDFIIDTGYTLSGTISDKGTSTAIANAMIYLIDQETEMLVGGRMYYSDNSGVYTINDIPDGVYTMIVSYPGYGVYEENDILLISDTTKNIQLEKGASFKGTVLDGSNSNVPLSGVLVIVTGVDVTPLYAVTGSDGTYEIGGLDAAKSYVIIAQKRDYVRQLLTGQTPASGGATVNFTLVKPAAVFNLSGTITSSCSVAVSDAIVIVSSASKNFFAVTTTNAAGAYSFTDLLQATDYRYVVIPVGDLKPVESTGNDTTSLTDVTWSPVISCGNKISGTISFSSGTAYVFLYKYDTNDFVDYTTAGTGGTYEFAGLDGNYKVFAVAGSKAEWYGPATDISNAASVAAGATGVNINLTD